MKKISFWLAFACLGVLHTSCKQTERIVPQEPDTSVNAKQTGSVSAGTFQNVVIPVADNPKDPQVFRASDGKFWMVYPDDNHYYAYHSIDLVTWTKQTSALLTASTGTFWSAGSYKYNNTYNLYFTANKGQLNKTIGVATSTSPGGPYTVVNSTLMVKQQGDGTYIPCIDPSVFKDPVTDKVYMYYARNVGSGTNPDLRSVELTANGLNTIAGTDKQVLTITQPWENVNIEHPLVYYASNAPASRRYYMLYNGSGGALARYAIGYAWAASPTGPFTKPAEGTIPGNNPLFQQNPAESIYGPGSPNRVVDDAGTMWMIYRIKTTSGESWSDRAISVDPFLRNSTNYLEGTPTRGTSQAKPFFN
ncbi:MAG TPA: family 43 glycosylhydrolase [Sphingobacteriaceae bacterium]|nr:family 43 glycosylhydrolase [Sphingobacteriaceae bacterium]